MAEPPHEDKSRKSDDRPSPEPDRKRRFAAAMARAEFGRFYWNAASERALRRAMAKKKPKR